MVRVARNITLTAVLCLVLAACGSVRRLDPNPSRVVDLSGNWTLDRAASDDPKPILAKLRPKPVSRRSNTDDDDSGPPQGAPEPGAGGGQRGGRGRRGGGGAGGQAQPQFAYQNGNEAYTHSSVLKMLTADLARADNMTIHQSEDRVSIDYGNSIRSFTPGSVSVVSAAWGVADQSSGWKGKDFLIEVKPQQGVATSERFSLSDDGKHLIEDLQMGGGEFPSIKLKRVYDQSDRPLQRTVPTND